MYAPYRDTDEINFKFPWERNTARGFGISLAITTVLLLLVSTVEYKFDKPAVKESKTKPIELMQISWGPGDGTGISKGNLSKEGAAHKGKLPSSDLEDAQIAGKTTYNKTAVETDPTQSQNLIAANEIKSPVKGENLNGSDAKNVGTSTGTPGGTGIGSSGYGKGAGEGYGDIEWGGGGNRVVLNKRLPVYPPGVNTNAQIKIKFIVDANGTVIKMIPLQRGEPALEKAAMNALRQWRFNPLKEDKDMYGIITFTFKLS